MCVAMLGVEGGYKCKSLKSNLVAYVQLLALDSGPIWSTFLGLGTKSLKQRL